MKKIYTLLSAVLFLMAGLHAQTFTITPRTVNVEGPNSGSKYALGVVKNDSMSATSDTLFSWTIIEYSVPMGWEFTFCDNYDCYYNLGNGSNRNFTLKPGESGPLKGDFIFNGTQGSARVKVTVKSVANPSNIDTFTMNASSWATGVKSITKQSQIGLYPNPAKDVVTIKYATSRIIEADIYNVLGSKVKSITLNRQETSVNVSDLQKGIYFIRFSDNGTVIAKQFTKSE